MINLKNISKTFDSKKVLDNVSFHIPRGTLTGLVGHNGAGKTTLMGILCGLIAPDKGEVHIAEIDLFKEMGRARSMIGYVPQKTSLYLEMSGRENLLYFGTMLGLSGDVLKRSLHDVAATTALEEHLDKRVIYYSGGMQKRLNLAIGLLGNPQVLFLDEPTVGVDPETREIILKSLVDLSQKKGTTVLYISHYFEEVQQICQHLIILEAGKVVADDAIERLQAEPLERYLQKSYYP